MSAADMIDEFLADKGVSLWPGQAFNLTREDTRHKAAVWFQDQIEQFYEWNSGIPLVIRDPDIDVDHLIAENKAAAAEIERLRGVAYNGERSWRDVAECQRLTIVELQAEKLTLSMELARR